MLNAPQFITALAHFMRNLSRNWDKGWNSETRKSKIEEYAIEAELTTKELVGQKRAASDFRIKGKNEFIVC